MVGEDTIDVTPTAVPDTYGLPGWFALNSGRSLLAHGRSGGGSGISPRRSGTETVTCSSNFSLSSNVECRLGPEGVDHEKGTSCVLVIHSNGVCRQRVP